MKASIVRHIAHHIWSERGEGSALDHWFEAEMRVKLLALSMYQQGRN